jgi:S1-C subfamily serine protease
VVALSLLFGGIGVELGGALFGSPATSSTAATPTANSATLPTVGSATPATGGAAAASSAADIAAKVDPAIVDITTTLANGQAAGTGMVLTPDGVVLTNNHVIADATEIRVQINGAGPIYAATVLGYDITDDVALLQIQGASNLKTIEVGDSDKVALHDKVVALGNALGRGGTPAVAEGSVTALDQTITAGDPGGPAQTLAGLIEINAPLLPGDSGGPLVNTSGQVIGMNAAAAPQSRRQNSSDGFAIPINTALDIAHQIQAGQGSAKVHIGDRALLGVQVQQGQGATVAATQAGSPAASAGLVAGDVIDSVDSTTISTLSDLTAALDGHHPGDKVSLGWTDTSGQHHTATVQLIAGPPA